MPIRWPRTGVHPKPTNADVHPSAEAADAHVHPSTDPTGNHVSAIGGIVGRPGRSGHARGRQTVNGEPDCQPDCQPNY